MAGGDRGDLRLRGGDAALLYLALAFVAASQAQVTVISARHAEAPA